MSKMNEKLNEIMDVFMDLSKNNPVLDEVMQMSQKMQEMVKSFGENKFDLTKTVFDSIDAAYNKYKESLNSIQNQEDIIKSNMKKLKNLYKDKISKKMKEIQKFQETKEGFNIIKESFKQYQDTLDGMNEQAGIFADTIKELKASYDKAATQKQTRTRSRAASATTKKTSTAKTANEQ